MHITWESVSWLSLSVVTGKIKISTFFDLTTVCVNRCYNSKITTIFFFLNSLEKYSTYVQIWQFPWYICYNLIDKWVNSSTHMYVSLTHDDLVKIAYILLINCNNIWCLVLSTSSRFLYTNNKFAKCKQKKMKKLSKNSNFDVLWYWLTFKVKMTYRFRSANMRYSSNICLIS